VASFRKSSSREGEGGQEGREGGREGGGRGLSFIEAGGEHLMGKTEGGEERTEGGMEGGTDGVVSSCGLMALSSPGHPSLPPSLPPSLYPHLQQLLIVRFLGRKSLHDIRLVHLQRGGEEGGREGGREHVG